MKPADFRIVAISIIAPLILSGCANIRPVGVEPNLLSERTPAPDEINWPAQYRPEDATFFISNRIDISAPPEVVWGVLIEAESWPTWYEGASNVVVLDSSDGILREDSEFTWRTMDLDFTSVIHEWHPPHRMGWESRRGDIKGYHAWLLIPTDDGTTLITDESQFGFLANMQRWFLPNRLRELHDVWLLEIKARAEARVSVSR